MSSPNIMTQDDTMLTHDEHPDRELRRTHAKIPDPVRRAYSPRRGHKNKNVVVEGKTTNRKRHFFDLTITVLAALLALSWITPPTLAAVAARTMANSKTSTETAAAKATVSQRRLEQPKSMWYKRYEHYPPYCSLPSDMDQRVIPAVATDSRTGESRLVHVTAVIRHGSRTPWGSNISCWEGYHDPSADTATWDCNLTTFQSPPTPNRVHDEEHDDSSSSTSSAGNAMLVFEKIYDGLQPPLSNGLHGTCQTGQLLLQGYEQELQNGKILRDAYVYDGKSFNHNARMRLIESSSRTTRIWDESNIYYRVDDDQRTVMSGQVILGGLMGPEVQSYYASKKDPPYPKIQLHTADRKFDVLDPNDSICPRLRELKDRYQRSQEYQAFMHSAEAVTLRKFMENVLHAHGDMDAIDCLMTTICTDRSLPDAINDYRGEIPLSYPPHHRHHHHNNRNLDDNNNATSTTTTDDPWAADYGTDRFARLVNFDGQRGHTLLIRANHGEYAKLGMTPLWKEIFLNLDAVVEERNHARTGKPPPKLALFSGHDTTLMPLLASLGDAVFDGVWTPYASMLLIEIHEINIDGVADHKRYKSNYAFRLLYNGKVLTHLIDQCPNDSELCDVQVLSQQVKAFTEGTYADYATACARQHPLPVPYQDAVSQAREIFSTPARVLGFLLLLAATCAAGSLGTFFYLTGSLPYNIFSSSSGRGGADEDGSSARSGRRRLFRKSRGESGDARSSGSDVYYEEPSENEDDEEEEASSNYRPDEGDDDPVMVDFTHIGRAEEDEATHGNLRII